jgi:hypothetical protein
MKKFAPTKSENNELKAFRVTGWEQYKTDAACDIVTVQLAKTKEEAMAQVRSRYAAPDFTVVLMAMQIS